MGVASLASRPPAGGMASVAIAIFALAMLSTSCHALTGPHEQPFTRTNLTGAEEKIAGDAATVVTEGVSSSYLSPSSKPCAVAYAYNASGVAMRCMQIVERAPF